MFYILLEFVYFIFIKKTVFPCTISVYVSRFEAQQFGGFRKLHSHTCQYCQNESENVNLQT